jgi:tRNA threonylcarbamoyladenosine biosynthesis protein TsaB
LITKVIAFHQPIFAIINQPEAHMSSDIIILQINTAFNEASMSISRNGLLVHEMINANQQEHAGFIQPAIKEICARLNISLNELSAVAVMNGPGSYTGLRVGLSSAKGICFALNIPLICINTLDWIAFGNRRKETDLICPMIDARRMEVFTGLYDCHMKNIFPSSAMVLDDDSFSVYLLSHTINFCGTGALKWKEICNNKNAYFLNETHDTYHFTSLAFNKFTQKRFANLAYSEPFYIKEFYTIAKPI